MGRIRYQRAVIKKNKVTQMSTRKSVHRTRMPRQMPFRKRVYMQLLQVYHEVIIKVDIIFKRTQLNL